MAIQVQVTADKQPITDLKAELIATAQEAEKLSGKLDLKNSIKKEFESMRDSMGLLTSALKEVSGPLSAVNRESLETATIMGGLTRAFGNVTKAIQDQTTELKKSGKEAQIAAEAEKELSRTKQQSLKYLESQKTTQQKVSEELRKFNKIAVEHNITGREHARIVELIGQKYKGAGLEIEQVGQRLTKQNSLWGKSSAEILKATSGWDLLSKRMQQNLLYQQKVRDAQGLLGKYLKDDLTVMQQHQNALTALNKMRSNGFLKGADNEQLYLQLKKNILEAIENEKKAQEGLNNARNKKQVSVQADTDYSNAVKHLEELRKTAGVLPKITADTARYNQSLKALTGTQREELKYLNQLNQDMNKLDGMYKKSISPIQKYKETLAAATRANQAFQRSNGKMGLSKDSMLQVISGARVDLLKANQATGLLGKGLLGLTGNFHLMTQATAAGRAAMIGAGQSFGIFEGRTIAVAAAVYTLARAIKSSITVGSEFEYLTDSIAVLTMDLTTLSNWGGSNGDKSQTHKFMSSLREETKFLREEMIQLAQDTQFSANEVVEAANILARSGMNVNDIYLNLGPVLDLAAIAMTDMANAADIATGVMASFNDGSIILRDAVDILAVTSVKTKATIDDLGLSIQYIGPLAAQAGLSFADTAAALGVLADVNIRGSKAGTSLRRVLIQLEAPGKKAKEALAGFGIDPNKLDLTEKGLAGIFKTLKQQGATVQELRDIFGVYALSAATALTMGAEKLQDSQNSMDGASGAAAKMRDLLRDNLKMEFEELTSTMEAIQVLAFEMFGPEITQRIAALSEYLEVNRGTFADWISTTVIGITKMVDWLIRNAEALYDLAKAYVILRGSIAVVMALNKAWLLYLPTLAAVKTSMIGTVASMGMAAATSGRLSAAFVGLAGAARTAWIAIGGPIGAAVLALGTVAYALSGTSSAAEDRFVPSFSRASEMVERFGDKLNQLPQEKLNRMLDSLERDIKVTYPEQLLKSNQAIEAMTNQLESYASRLETVRGILANNELIDAVTRLGTLSLDPLGVGSKLTQLFASKEEIAILEKIKEAQQGIFEEQQKQLDLKDELTQKEQQYGQVSTAVSEQSISALKKVALNFKAIGLEDEYQRLIEKVNEFNSKNAALAATKRVSDFGFDVDNYEEVKSRIEFLEGFPERMASDAVFASVVLNTFWKQGISDPAAVAAQQLQVARTAMEELLKAGKGPQQTIVENPAISKAASELTKYFEAYEKAKGPIYAVVRELESVDSWMVKLSSNTPIATAALKKAGMTMEDARAAMDWTKEQQIWTLVESTLGGVDARFKNLRDVLNTVSEKELDVESATDRLRAAMINPDFARAVELYGGFDKVLGLISESMSYVVDKSKDLSAEWEKLRKEAAEFEVSITGTTDSFDELVKRYAEINGVTPEMAKKTLALVKAKDLLGDSLKKTADEAEILAMAQQSLNILVSDGTITAERAAKAYTLLWSSQPIGKLEAQNLQVQAQVQLLKEGAREQAIYSEAVSAFGANWMYASDAFKAAAGSLYDVNEELRQSQELKAAYTEFGEGVLGIFADLASGMETSFSSAADSLRDMFKKLLRDLIYMAARNAIMINLGMEGSNSGSGNSSVWGWATQLMSSMWGSQSSSTGAWSVLNAASSGSSAAPAFYGANNFGLSSLLGTNANSGNWQMAGNSNSGPNGLNLSSLSTWTQIGKTMWTGFTKGIGSLPAVQSALGALSNIGALSGMISYNGASMAAINAGMSAGGMGPSSALAGSGSTSGFGLTGSGASAAGMAAWFAAAIAANFMAYQSGWQKNSSALTLPNGQTIYGGGSANIDDSPAAALGAAGIVITNAAASLLSKLGFNDKWANILSGASLVTRIFGRRAPRLTDSNISMSVGPDGVSAREAYGIYEKGGWLASSKRYTKEFEASAETLDAANTLFNVLSEVMTSAAGVLKSDAAEMLDATLSIKTEYEKDGTTIKSSKYIVDLMGRTWEHATKEEAVTRLMAEATIAAIDKALGTTVDTLQTSTAGPNLRRNKFSEFDESLEPIITSTLVTVGEASNIAERWRESAEKLAEGSEFLLLAASDIRNGSNLLNDGSLTQITDLIESLVLEEESLAEAYARVFASAKLLDQAFALSGATTDKTREQFVRFSADVVTSMGGVETAQSKWSAFFQAFYSAGELAVLQQQEMAKYSEHMFSAIGLNFQDFLGDTGLEDFRALFDAALPTLSPSQVNQWVEAGLALAGLSEAIQAIHDVIESNALALAQDSWSSFQKAMYDLDENFRTLTEEATGLGATTEQLALIEGQYAQARKVLMDKFREQIDTILTDNDASLNLYNLNDFQKAQNEVNQRFDEMRYKLVDLGATQADLTRLEQQRTVAMQQAREVLAGQLADFMQQQDPTLAFQALQRTLKAARDQAVALGASEAQLTRLRRLQHLEVARFIADLRRSILESWESLSQTLGTGASSMSDSMNSAYETASDLYELERERWQNAQDAIKNITDYLMDLETSDLSPGDWSDRLAAGRSNFDEMLERARLGDADALNEITQYAQTLLTLGQDALGDGVAYNELYRYVTDALRSLRDQLQTIPEPPPIVSDSSGNDSSTVSMTTLEATSIDTYWAILDLAEKIGTLNQTTESGIYSILDQYGIPLTTLVSGLGVTLNNLTMEGLESLSLLATAFNTNFPEMLNELRVNPVRVAELLGVSIADLREGLTTGLAEFAEFLGVPIVEALGYIGISLDELAPKFGVFIENMTAETLANLSAMAEALGILPVQLVELLEIPLGELATAFGYQLGISNEENLAALRDLASTLGMSLWDLGVALGENFSVIVGALGQEVSNVFLELPEDIGPEVRDNLTNLFEELGQATSPEQVSNILGNLLTYTRDSLPGSFATALTEVLTTNGFTIPEATLETLSTAMSNMAYNQQIANSYMSTMTDYQYAGNTIMSSVHAELVRIADVLAPIEEPPPEPVESMGDNYIENIAATQEASKSEIDELYARLEESQDQIAELTERLAEAIEALNSKQTSANSSLNSIKVNTGKAARKTKETKKA